MTQERMTPPDFLHALTEARRLLSTARVGLTQRAAAHALSEEMDRALALVGPRAEGAGDDLPVPSALDRERESRVMAEGAQRRTEFLYQASSALFDSPLDAVLRCQRLAALCVPDLADWCLCDLLEGKRVRRVAVRQWNPDRDVIARSLEVTYPLSEDAPRGISRVLTRGKPEMSAEHTSLFPEGQAAAPELDELLRVVGARSYLIVPMVGTEGVIGALTFLFAESNRRYGAADLRLAEDLARRAALAQSNASLFQQLQRAVQSREEMVAVVSHDLRNPLSSIKMSATMLQEDEVEGAHNKSKTSIILRAVGRMEALLRNLLDVASLDAGTLTLERRRVVVNEVVAEAIESIQPIVVSKQLVVTTSLAPGLELFADVDRLLQVFSNLLGNAAKFSSAGGEIRLSAVREGTHCRFSVGDAGPGIAPEHVAHVFDRFWQGRERRREGAGLGLAIAKGIVDAHLGVVGVESTLGVGTTFTFTIPLA